MKVKRAVVYARVSTDEQAEKGYSLPSQLDLCRKYAERLGYRVVKELTEDHSGATPIAERPVGKRLAEIIKAREVDALIVYQVDRLSRDIVNLLATVQTWLRRGLEIHTCDIGKIESELDIVLVIKGWQGSDERKRIRERCMRGKRAKMQAGKLVCTRAPYGYALVRDANNRIVALAIVPEAARIIRLIYQWYVYGDENEEPLSQEKIMDRLNAMRAPTAGKRKKTKAGEWNRQAVSYILSNEVYAGIYRYGVLIGATNNRRPLEEAVSLNVPPIVDRKTWERAQKRRKYNRAMALRNNKHHYLLRGMIRCSCNTAVRGMSKTKTRFYYVCLKACGAVRKRLCHASMVRGEILELQIWEGIKQRIKDIEKLESDLRAAQQEEIATQEPKREEYEAVENNIAQTKHKAEGLVKTLASLAHTDPDGIVAQSMQAEIDQTNALYNEQVARRDQLKAELETRILTDDVITDIVQYAKDVREGVDNANWDDKRKMLEALGVKVKLQEQHFYAKCILGEWDQEVLSLRAYRDLSSSLAAGSPLESCLFHPWAANRETQLTWVL